MDIKYRQAESYCVNGQSGVGVPVATSDIDSSLARLIGIASWDSLEKSCTAMDGIEATLAVAMSSNRLAPDT